MRTDLTGTLMKGLDDVIGEAETYVIIYVAVLVGTSVVNIIILIL